MATYLPTLYPHSAYHLPIFLPPPAEPLPTHQPTLTCLLTLLPSSLPTLLPSSLPTLLSTCLLTHLTVHPASQPPAPHLLSGLAAFPSPPQEAGAVQLCSAHAISSQLNPHISGSDSSRLTV